MKGNKPITSNNPKGKNQHKDCPPSDDPRVSELLMAYHRQGITDRKRLSRLLREEHELIMSEATIARRKRELGLRASGLTTAELPDSTKRQLILDQIEKDPSGKMGATTVKARIFEDTGINITRDWIRKEMQSLAPDAYASRRTSHKSSGSHSAKSVDDQAQTPLNTEGAISPPGVQQVQAVQNLAINEQFDDYPVFSFGDPSVLENHPGDLGLSNESHIPPFFDLEPSEYNHTPNHHLPTPSTHSRPSNHVASFNETLSIPIPVLLSILNLETPKIVRLTQFLSNIDCRQFGHAGDIPGAAYNDVVRCMEAAAMLERQLSRLASGLQL